jgi:hypothetical protein
MALARRTQLALWLAIVLATGLTLLETGIYGWMLFVIVPFALGLFAAGMARPATVGRAAAAGACTV